MNERDFSKREKIFKIQNAAKFQKNDCLEKRQHDGAVTLFKFFIRFSFEARQ